jgi:hypothetical protein
VVDPPDDDHAPIGTPSLTANAGAGRPPRTTVGARSISAVALTR